MKKRCTPARKGRMSREKRMEQREARAQLVATAIARQQAEPLSVDDLSRIPVEFRTAVETIASMTWDDFVEAVRIEVEHPNPNVETVVELSGSTDEGATPIR